jgi:ATP-dependent DNA helicase DinG
MTSVLSDKTKTEIQKSYRFWLDARKFRPRRGQREMIAQIARTLVGDAPRIVALEAGTGTGKTAAYCIAAIPLGKELGKTIVITTATVALQEQVVLRDLPDLAEHAQLNFSFALAKGRGRYVCLKRLDDQLKYSANGGAQTEIPLFDATPDGAELYPVLLSAFADKSWNGDRDSYSQAIDDGLWRGVTTDHRGCTNNKCSFFRQCPFFQARGGLDGVDVIVANHDLVLSDLSLGGGAVLPEPEACIYIIDEAHHLPEKTQQHFSRSARIRSSGEWVDNVASVLGSLTQRFSRPDALLALVTKAAHHGGEFAAAMSTLGEAVAQLEYVPRDDTLATHRFAHGLVPEALVIAADAARQPLADLARVISDAHELLQKAFAGELGWERGFEAEDWLPVVGQLETRALATLALLGDYAAAGDDAKKSGPAYARWANDHGIDFELVSAPIQPGSLLQEALWSRCFAAVCTSATLTAAGRFNRFLERTGLQKIAALRIPSPFDFQSIATLTVPAMQSDPRDFHEHSAEVVELLPGLLTGDPSALILFTSWRQMRAVVAELDADVAKAAKVQGDSSKQALLDAHRADVDAGRRSYIFGLASFAEGVDLPDDYCRHVVVVKLPFAVPDDPVDQALAEWAESQGKNAFYEISVPDAALRLVQACGRLIRHEGDYGRITLLDKRIVTKRYGRDLLDSLPPYKLHLNAV